LTDAKKKEIHDKILNDTKYRKIDAVFTVDESIIGGMIILAGVDVDKGRARVAHTYAK